MQATAGLLGTTTGKWVCQIMAAEGVIGVLGNLLVCYVILRVKFLHNMTNYLLVNLAVADMLLCLAVFFSSLTAVPDCIFIDYVPASFGGKMLFCRLVASGFLTWALSYVSAYNLCVVTLERYVAILHPLHYARKLTATRMKILIALMWVTSFVFSVPVLFSIEPSDDPDRACSASKHSHWSLSVQFTKTFAFLTAYLLPLTLMSLAYYKIQVTLKRQAKALNLQHARAAAYDLVIARRRLVSMLTIVLGALIILWTPGYIHVLLCLGTADESQLSFCGTTSSKYVASMSAFAFYFNSVINPIIYEFKYKKFKQGLKAAVCCCFSRHGNNRVDV
ncbi:histamine H2 receptor-like [Patiria miniata]|uniref:G-protein coupled receptors family 1 profile domain-containing protein n=1 Tax=Patiria miniata TaxID=46514 RepID=A0A913ZN03_PATMI|nr:histamine H2 receptor-like [Patiria miniata]